jgi:hypothetical protein
LDGSVSIDTGDGRPFFQKNGNFLKKSRLPMRLSGFRRLCRVLKEISRDQVVQVFRKIPPDIWKTAGYSNF